MVLVLLLWLNGQPPPKRSGFGDGFGYQVDSSQYREDLI
jgi:hypothetical protein